MRTFSRWFSLGSCNTQTKCGLPHHLQTRENTHFFIFPIFKNPYRMRAVTVAHFLDFWRFWRFFSIFKLLKPYRMRAVTVAHVFFYVIS
jgi:hypothetical protein